MTKVSHTVSPENGGSKYFPFFYMPPWNVGNTTWFGDWLHLTVGGQVKWEYYDPYYNMSFNYYQYFGALGGWYCTQAELFEITSKN